MADSHLFELKNLINYATHLFRERFHSEPDVCGCGPGRVNLIGEHTDYNDGFVLPMALTMVTVMIGKKNLKQTCHILTCCPAADDPKHIEFEIRCDGSTLLCPGKPAWANYVKGVIANFKGKLYGFNAIIVTSVPVGSGLSSSAALEVATYTFLEGISSELCNISATEKALICQRAEHEFAGTPCGIMDQYISFMGKRDYALLLDCRSLHSELISLKLPEISFLITNTNVHHKLAESEYSTRKKQCETAAKILKKHSLRDVTLQDLEDFKDKLGDEIYRRALHVVTEIQRTQEAAKALHDGNSKYFGKLMQESHISLRDNYEVSCSELDIVVNAALEVNGVLGSRMTGGGFGGCTITLLKSCVIDEAIHNIKKRYENPTFYICHPGDGAKIIKLPL